MIVVLWPGYVDFCCGSVCDGYFYSLVGLEFKFYFGAVWCGRNFDGGVHGVIVLFCV